MPNLHNIFFPKYIIFIFVPCVAAKRYLFGGAKKIGWGFFKSKKASIFNRRYVCLEIGVG
jgi:hypothetical protein